MLISTNHLTKQYPKSKAPSVCDANIGVAAGETIGLFGESGSGKSTMGMMLAGLLKPSSGSILYKGEPVSMPYRNALRRDVQILFQHPEISFNPVLPLRKSMIEPYTVSGIRNAQQDLIAHIAAFGLKEEQLRRVPSELSGGELQRAALARILVLKPKVIILDEPTSMLDVITQAQIIQMLRDYQKETDAAFVFVSHNRVLCEKLCNRIYTVESGKFGME